MEGSKKERKKKQISYFVRVEKCGKWKELDLTLVGSSRDLGSLGRGPQQVRRHQGFHYGSS